jgi:ribulose-5-phosphate 4-epimerase/fuculose-1-phosphate aldolase
VSDHRDELALLGAELSALEWVQGPGGNVSVKAGGLIHVKASGRRLADVARDGGHVGVPRELALAALEGDDAATAALFAISPKPSLETFFHAIPDRVVVHLHPARALLVACTEDPAPPEAADVPYELPGRALGQAVARARARGATSFLLRNHGTIVVAATAREAIERAHALDRAMRVPDVEPFPALVERYRAAPSIERAGGFARELPPVPAPPRYLFPDAIVYTTHVAVRDARLASLALGEVLADARKLATLVARDRDGRRAIVARTREGLDAALEVAAAHDWVEAAIEPARRRYLADAESDRILGMDMERYRRALMAGE